MNKKPDFSEGMVVLNLLQQPVKVPITIIGEETALLEINHLASGIYFIKTKEVLLKVVKE